MTSHDNAYSIINSSNCGYTQLPRLLVDLEPVQEGSKETRGNTRELYIEVAF